jgi:hypothetical protein
MCILSLADFSHDALCDQILLEGPAKRKSEVKTGLTALIFGPAFGHRWKGRLHDHSTRANGPDLPGPAPAVRIGDPVRAAGVGGESTEQEPVANFGYDERLPFPAVRDEEGFATARLECQGPENDRGDTDSEQNGSTCHGAIPDPQVRDDRPGEVENCADAGCDSDGPQGETDEQSGRCGEFECGEQWCRFGRFHKLQDGYLVWVFADLADCGENAQGREEDAEDGCCNEHWSYPF